MEKEPLTFHTSEESEKQVSSKNIPPLRDYDEESPGIERGLETEVQLDKTLLEGLETKRDPNAEADIESAREGVERRLEKVAARLAEEKEKLASVHDGLGLREGVQDSASIRALEEAKSKLETEYATIEHAATFPRYLTRLAMLRGTQKKNCGISQSTARRATGSS